MVCEHLKSLDEALSSAGVHVVYRDQQPWTKNCRNWTRYACVIDIDQARRAHNFDDCVVDWEIDDPWQGQERGFVCNEYHDAVIGDVHPRKPSRHTFRERASLWALPVIGTLFAILALVFAIVVRLRLDG